MYKIRKLDEQAIENAEKKWNSIAKPLHSLGVFEEIVKNNPEEVYQAMFIESVQTIQSFSHRPSVIYFFEEIFPELLRKDFYGKEEFIVSINNIIM